MKLFIRILCTLLVAMLLPLEGYAQTHVITRPSAKPKTEQKAKPARPAQHQSATMTPQQRVVKEIIANMVYVEGGTFMMGASAQDGEAKDNEKPAHQVTLSGFHISKYEVTQRQWRVIMGTNPSDCKGDDLPVNMVTWNDCVAFITKLNRLSGRNFRLPTEAEWEFAARGGNKSRGYKYAGTNNPYDVWTKANSGARPQPVGSKLPNELGLYDMSGNVEEWVLDYYGPYTAEAQTDPYGPTSGLWGEEYRVYRGGSFNYSPEDSRVTCRTLYSATSHGFCLGFRLAM